MKIQGARAQLAKHACAHGCNLQVSYDELLISDGYGANT